MNIESIRDYCLSLPYATEDTPFDQDTLVFRIIGKIFACLSLERPDYFVVKCDADYSITLRDKHPEIKPAWHWNKKYWNQISLSGTLPDSFIEDLVRHSYAQVVAKLSKKQKGLYPGIEEIC